MTCPLCGFSHPHWEPCQQAAQSRLDRPLAHDNPDEWARFMCRYVDARATCPDGIMHLSYEIVAAIEAAHAMTLRQSMGIERLTNAIVDALNLISDHRADAPSKDATIIYDVKCALDDVMNEPPFYRIAIDEEARAQIVKQTTREVIDQIQDWKKYKEERAKNIAEGRDGIGTER